MNPIETNSASTLGCPATSPRAGAAIALLICSSLIAVIPSCRSYDQHQAVLFILSIIAVLTLARDVFENGRLALFSAAPDAAPTDLNHSKLRAVRVDEH
ncbi:hypothetical protein Aduo_013138 [Ancylostoma duodenale]